MANETAQAPSSLVERKLVTILSADVAEYSRLMSEDEEHTLRIFREHTQTFRALVDMHHGRIFNTAGDALLAEFTSPVEAVRCATDIQAALRTRNDQLPKGRQVRFRIGVNLGDVMMQNSDLLGDGVNVASRLQSAAEPGGICISGSVYDQIRNKLSLNIESLGERQYKNIPQPVRTFTIAGSEDDGLLPVSKKSFQLPRIALPRIALPRIPLKSVGIAALLLLVLAGGYWGYSSLPQSEPTKPTAAPKIAVATAQQPIAVESSGLLADAQNLQRPQSELDALTDANSKIAALALQLRGLGTGAGKTAKPGPVLAQMKSLAIDTSVSEASALGSAGNQLWKDIAKPPGRTVTADAGAAIATATEAKAKLDDAVAAAQSAPDGATSLKAARQALAAYDAFFTAYGAATPFYVQARRSDFAAMAAVAQGISDKVVALSKGNKPWILASHARKEAYQTLADNAAEAQTQIAKLDELKRRADVASDLRRLSTALARASVIKVKLNSLYAASNAAYAVYSQ